MSQSLRERLGKPVIWGTEYPSMSCLAVRHTQDDGGVATESGLTRHAVLGALAYAAPLAGDIRTVRR